MVGKTTSRFLDSIRDVFLGKSVLNFIGFVLQAAIVVTLSGSKDLPSVAGVEMQAPPDGVMMVLLRHAVSYVLLVLFVVAGRDFLNRKMSALSLSKSREQTLKAVLAGLTLIPAWSFKGFVGTAVEGTAWWTSLVVLAGAVTFAIVIEPPAPAEGEVPTTVQSLRVTLSGCMPLGVGFAVHRMVVVLWRMHGFGAFFTIPVTLCYALIMTTTVVLMQLLIGHALSALTATPRGQPSPVTFWTAFLMFSSSSGNFVVAWAWDAVLDANRVGATATSNLDSCFSTFAANSLWAILVLAIAGVVLCIQGYVDDYQDDGRKHSKMYLLFHAMVGIVLAMNITWSWLDAFVSLHNGQRADGSWCIDYRGYHVLGAWVCAVIITVLAVALIQGGTQLIEYIKG